MKKSATRISPLVGAVVAFAAVMLWLAGHSLFYRLDEKKTHGCIKFLQKEAQTVVKNICQEPVSVVYKTPWAGRCTSTQTRKYPCQAHLQPGEEQQVDAGRKMRRYRWRDCPSGTPVETSDGEVQCIPKTVGRRG